MEWNPTDWDIWECFGFSLTLASQHMARGMGMRPSSIYVPLGVVFVGCGAVEQASQNGSAELHIALGPHVGSTEMHRPLSVVLLRRGGKSNQAD